jgi:hypothetical protein
MDLKQTGPEDSNWIKLYQDAVQWRDIVKTVMYFRAQMARNSLIGRATLSLLGRILLYAVG